MNSANYSRRDFVEIALKVVGIGAIGGVGSLYGCARSGVSNSPAGPTISLTDTLGRTLDIPKEPQLIAVIDSYAGEYLVTIGAGPRLATIQNGTQSAELLRIVSPEIGKIPNAMVSGTINVETVLASGAQVALVAPGTYQNKPQSEKLDRLGIPVAAIGFQDVDSQIEAMGMLGRVCGGNEEKKSDELIEYYKNIVEFIETRVAEIPEKDRLRVYHSNSTALTTDGDVSLGTDWVTRCGGIVVSRDAKNAPGSRMYETSVEQVYLWDPDIIICSQPLVLDGFVRATSWKGLRAIKESKVYQIPIGATRWGQNGSAETYLGMLWFAATIYPQYFTDLDLKKEVTTYYSHFLGLDITDALYEQILSGRGLRQSTTLNNGLLQKEQVA